MPLAACVSLSRRVLRWLVAPVLMLGVSPTVWAQPVVPRPAGAERAIDNPTGRITLRNALALALLQNSELATFAWEVRAREARAIQAGRPPNPVLDTLVEDLGGAARLIGGENAVQPQTTIQLGQLIELGGKRAARERLAELNRDLAAWDFEGVRIDVLTRVSTAYLDVLAGQQTVALAGRTRALAEQVQETVSTRVEAGVVSPIERTKSEVALAGARIDEQRARRALDADRLRLATLWGSDVAAFAGADGDLAIPPRVPAFDLLRQRVTQNPEVARWATEIAQRDAARAVQDAHRVPDVTVTAGYRRFTDIDSNAFLVGASIPLPLFDRNRAGVQEATDRAAKAREEQRAAQGRVTAMLADAYGRLASAHDEASALASGVLPGARSAFELVQEGYRLGRFGFLDVLDAQRTLVGAEGQYLRALIDWHKAVAQVERLIAMPLADAAAPPPPTCTDTPSRLSCQ
jgi:cobalt-zinc-cadmium efflux system outer membrane protein